MALNDTKAQINIINASINLSKGDVSANPELQSRRLAENQELVNLFRKDLFMFAEGDLFTEENLNKDTVDLKRIAGVYNYAQAITHRLMTTRGTLPADSSFGVPWGAYLGQTYSNRSIILANLMRDIQDEIYKDTRTQRVISVDAVFENPNVISVDCAIMPIGLFTEIDINVVIGVA